MVMLLRSRVLLVVAVALSLTLFAGRAQAQWSPIAESEQPGRLVPVMDSFAGVTVYSERETGADGPASDTYFLTVLRNGQRRRLAIEPRAGVPFDVDLGPDGRGGLVAAYSRCATEPDAITVRDRFGARVFARPYPAWTTGRGCDVYRYDFSSGRETKLAGASTDQASEMLPSIWKDEVAFARVYERREGRRDDLDLDRLPYLYVRSLTGSSASSRRQPGSARGTNGLPGPTRLDLYGRRLSFVWSFSTGQADDGEIGGTSEVRLDTVDGGHRVLSRAKWGGKRPYASFVGPQGSAGRIFYGYQRAETREGDDRSVVSLLLRYRISTADKAINVDVPPFLVDTSTNDSETTIGTGSSDFSYMSAAARIQRDSSVSYREGRSVTVPDIVGMPRSRATCMLQRAGLRLPLEAVMSAAMAPCKSGAVV
ncbi:MAG: hypothetical protein ACR2NB_08305 [Solirubrobacteraceae bacterium]